MRKRIAFDVKAAIPAAWDVLWADRMRQRKEDLAYEKKVGKKPFNWAASYYVTATDVEQMVRDFAEDTAAGKPWRKVNNGGYGHIVRIGGDLKSQVRAWLLRGNGGKITGHNFGRGHVSGMRFRPVGEPMAEAEKKTIENHKKRRSGELPPRPIHFSQGGLLCQRERTKGRSWSRSNARSTKDQASVTCKQCINLMKRAPQLIQPQGSISHMADGNTHN